MRDRRSRGPRGPLSLPGPLSPDRVPIDRTPREAFSSIVMEALDRLVVEFDQRRPGVDVAVEEAPLLPRDWQDPIPLSTLYDSADGLRHVVLFRRPISEYADDETELSQLVWDQLTRQLAVVWDCRPSELGG